MKTVEGSIGTVTLTYNSSCYWRDDEDTKEKVGLEMKVRLK